jgi:hypothetical protein
VNGQHDEREPEPSRDLSAEEERRVRALLAEARHTDPMPTDVAARLDRVIAGLSEGAPREADVVPLATRRRRASRLLLAAAAVVVLGVGGSQVLDGLGMAGSDDSGAGEASMPAAEAESGAEAGGEGGVAEDRANDESEEAPVPSAATRVAKVRPRSFAADAQALRDGSAAFLGDANSARDADERAPVCAAGEWGPGSYVAVRYAGDPGWIVFRRPKGDTQVADLFLCGGEVASRSLTLPYP